MSLILDALNRSRHDADPVPGLASPHYSESGESGLVRWRRWLPWIALLCALLVIGWLLMGKAGNQAPAHSRSVGVGVQGGEAGVKQPGSKTPDALSVGPASNTAAEATPPPPALPIPTAAPYARPKPRPARPSELVAGPQRASPSTSAVGFRGGVATPPDAEPETDAAVARLYQSAAKPTAVKPTAEKPVAEKPVAEKPVAEKPVAEKPVAEKSVAEKSARQPQLQTAASSRPKPEEAVADTDPQETDEQPIDIAEVLSQVERELGKAQLADHPAPFLAGLSQQEKDTIPTLMYQKHDYASSTGSSLVVINGKTVRVGGSVAAGVRVDEILPSSVILSHRGTQFRLRALNSWVNL